MATKNQPTTIGCTYRPPNSDPDDFCSKLETCLRAINLHTHTTLILGDMNGKNSDWLPSDTTDRAGDNLSYLFDAYNLQQHVNFATRITNGFPKSCIDLVASNLQDHQVQLEPAAPLGSSDHLSIVGSLDITPPPSTHPSTHPVWIWYWNPENLEALRSDLAVTELLPPESNTRNCDDLWAYWRDTLLQKAHLYCTSFCSGTDAGPHKLYPRLKRPWMTDDILQSIQRKHKLHRAYLKSHRQEDWTAFKIQRNLTTEGIRHAKSSFVQSNTPDANKPQTNRKNLYSFMKCLKTAPRSDIPDLKYSGQTLSSPFDKATALNDFFISESQKSVGNPNQAIPRINCNPVINSSLKTFATTPEEVCRHLKALDDKTCAGDDGIPTRLLKAAASELSSSLCQLFNISFTKGDQPQAWRDATISPVHKKGSKTLPTNYRPISLLSVASKVQEKIVHDRLYNHIDPHLPPHQSGFRKKDGTELQLLRLIHEVSESRDKGKAVATCFFDLSKAFDRVWHKGLLAKLQHAGVCEASLAWFTTYLTRRRQRVRANSALSQWQTIPAGVPQGSVLGPLLFLIYTIDLPPSCTNLSITCSQFADDTALVTINESADDAQHSLQDAVTSAATWLTDWHLLVNATKTVVMSFQRQQRLQITINGTLLQQVSSHRHLGLIIQADLRWSDHVGAKIKKARHELFQLRRIRNTLYKPALVSVYTIYIRPILEYGSLVLSSLSQTSHDRLESLQRHAGRVCLGLPLFEPTHHSSLLHHTSLPTLSSRRQYRQLVFAHALVHGRVPHHLRNTSRPDFAQRSHHDLRRQRTYAIPTTRTTRHRDSPVNNAAHHYNNLPQDLTSIVDALTFKQAIAPLILSSICSCSAHPDLH